MLYIGSDHAGFALKEQVKGWLEKEGIAFKDVGAFEKNKKDDYPVFGYEVASRLKTKDRGLVFCGSSFGVCIVANKVTGVRAVSANSEKEAKLARKHNNANVLCLSGWNTSVRKAKKIIISFLETPFSKEPRHRRRVKQIREVERGHRPLNSRRKKTN